MCLPNALGRLSPVRLVIGLVGLMSSAGCGFLSGDGRVTIATATVTVTPESTSEATSSAPTTSSVPPTTPNEPAELRDLELTDPSVFMNGPKQWAFAAAAGDVVCKFVVGDNGLCHVVDDSGPPWNAGEVCDLHRDEDPDGARSSLVGWDSDYRPKPCHTLLEGGWPANAPTLPSGKKLVLQVDPVHGVVVTCGQQGPNLTCANNNGHGFTAGRGSPRLW